MKKQKKYVNPNMVIRDIHAVQKKITMLKLKADGEDSCADLMAEAENQEVDRHRENAKEFRKKAERLETTRLLKLKRVLAAVQTIPLGLEGFTKPQVTLEDK